MRGKFKPNNRCTLIRQGTTDQYGEQIPGEPETVGCSVVRLQWQSKKTLFSRVHSATAGGARENTAVSVLLFHPDVGVDIDDEIHFEALGVTLRVSERHPRFDVKGVLHHIEVKGVAA
ncbi:hypothetical protein [Cupriavidus metallidurans]|uniref:hypothetical protein n=1 Tax=Cupriavidus metallidurans TaxID=119219 RepID=UPI001CCF4335|nr:hypothetical protein [Cupriavidus metallidurans]UBM12761.1 hypothetical protein LAI70_27805 [Cupriavidus metallidurans]